MNSTWLRVSLVVAFASAMAFSQSTYSNINALSGWQSCGSCAGPGGSGPNTPRSLTLGIASPSLDGKSARFSIAPIQSFSNALWWKQLGGTSANNLIYDFFIYIKNPGASQALEFDVNQASNGVRHIFGTECDLLGAHGWRVYGNGRWNSTGVTCALKAGQFNHVVWEFSRANGGTHFVSITVNGVKHMINRTYPARSSSSHELNVAVQMDGNASRTAYSIFLDEIKLTTF